jgi:hypothetical protein
MDYSPYYFKNFYNRKAVNKNYFSKKQQHNEFQKNEQSFGNINKSIDLNNSYDVDIVEKTDGQTHENSALDKEKTSTYEANIDFCDKLVNAKRHLIKSEDYREKAFHRNKSRNALVVSILILISFIVIILTSESLGGLPIATAIKTLIRPRDDGSYFFLVSNGFDTKSESSAFAKIITNGGGAGYVYVEKQRYFVVVSTYLDKKSAESVMAKNKSLNMIEIKLTKPDYSALKATETGIAKKARTTTRKCIERLYLSSIELDLGTSDVTSTLATVNDIRNELLTIKTDIIESELTSECKQSLCLYIDTIFDKLGSIKSENLTINKINSIIRKTIAETVVSLKDSSF